jgi:hypothetical protein
MRRKDSCVGAFHLIVNKRLMACQRQSVARTRELLHLGYGGASRSRTNFFIEVFKFSSAHTMAMHVKFSTTALQCMYKDLKTLQPCGIRTRDLLFWRRTR